MRQGSRGRGAKGSRDRSQKSEDRRQRSKIVNSKLITQNSKLHSRGFTLIELIIFIIIAGIFLPATYVAFSAAMQRGTQPEDYTRGMLLTEQVMELATKRGYTLLASDTSSLPSCAAIGVNVTTGYICSWTPRYVNFSGGAFSSPDCSVSYGSTTNYICIAVSVTTPQGNTFSSTGMVTNHGF